MKYFLLLFSIVVLGCKNQETKPELDYVKIDIFPGQIHIPSAITVDLKSKTLSFTDLTQMVIIPEDCACTFEMLEPSVDFEYIKLNETEFNDIKVLFGKYFYSDIKKFNTEYLKNKNSSEYLYNEGTRHRISIVKDSITFTTQDFLILDGHSERKIYEILKIIKKHTKSNQNKKYIESLISRI